MTDRTAARLAGALFLMATVPFSIAVVLLDPVLGASDYLARASESQTRIAIGALLELVNHISVVGIAVVLYPILRRFGERVAAGYVAARSIEAVLFAMGTMNLLTLVGLGREFVAAGSPAASHFQTLAGMLWAGHDWDEAVLAFMAFSIGALMLNYLLFRARLVPRWLAVWGLLGAVSILAARILLLAGVPLSVSSVTAMDVPIMLQEMVFAVWLIVRGFDPEVLRQVGVRGSEPDERRV